MRLTPEQQATCAEFLDFAYGIAGKVGPFDATDRRSTAHMALCRAVAAFDPADGRPIREHIRKKVGTALRTEYRRDRRRRELFRNLGDKGWAAHRFKPLPAPCDGIAGGEWLDHTLGQLGDIAEEALAHRVFVNGETPCAIAAEVDPSPAFRMKLTRKVNRIRDRIADIITTERGGQYSCN